MLPKRQQPALEFKGKVALEARKGKATVSELASRSGVYPTMINERKRPLLDVVCGMLERGGRRAPVIDEHLRRASGDVISRSQLPYFGSTKEILDLNRPVFEGSHLSV